MSNINTRVVDVERAERRDVARHPQQRALLVDLRESKQEANRRRRETVERERERERRTREEGETRRETNVNKRKGRIKVLRGI